MKVIYKILLIQFLFLGSLKFGNAQANVSFDSLFVRETLRLDFLLSGSRDTQLVSFGKFVREPFWGGSLVNLIDSFEYGDYQVWVFENASEKVIYSRGFSTLFAEWLTTDEATKLNRTFFESVVMPMPKTECQIVLLKRDRKNVFHQIFQIPFSPSDYFVQKHTPVLYKSEKVYGKSVPEKSLDIVFMPEGYTEKEMKKFKSDCEKFIGYFFKVKPFSDFSEKVNFYMIYAPSVESGTDVPGKMIWMNTKFNSNFYTFDVDRYLTTMDVWEIRDVAASVPYDQIVILVNTAQYGGGGILNNYNIFSADNQYSEQVFTHEFGHGFGALADEYFYDTTVDPASLYDLSVEPWSVNLTTLVNFESKWADLVDKNTPIPTPLSYANKVGAYEGGGYVFNKIYRPVDNCKMRTNAVNEFCPVCNRALTQLLRFYTE